MDETLRARQRAETLASLRDHHAAAVLRGDDTEVIRIVALYEEITDGKLLLAVEQDDGSAISIEV